MSLDVSFSLFCSFVESFHCIYCHSHLHSTSFFLLFILRPHTCIFTTTAQSFFSYYLSHCVLYAGCVVLFWLGYFYSSYYILLFSLHFFLLLKENSLSIRFFFASFSLGCFTILYTVRLHCYQTKLCQSFACSCPHTDSSWLTDLAFL